MSRCPREASPGSTRENYLLPPEPSAETVTARVKAVAQFLRWGLPLCQTHTVEFYTRGLWEKFVALPPETVLGTLSGERLQHLLAEPTPQRPLEEVADSSEFYNMFCKKTQRLINVQAFALAAKYYSMPNLGVCISLEQILEALNRKQQSSSKVEMKTDNFMNNKKSHEVQLMSDLVDGIAKYYGLNQVIDLGSGKGYLSSFLSLQYNLKVYGIDSSNTNTHGANERNRKLKKHWTAYQRRAGENVRGQALEEAKKRAEQDKEKCKANTSEKPLRTNNSLESQVRVAVPDVAFETAELSPDPNICITKKQYELNPEAQDCVIVGLHTCGDLAPSTLRLFNAVPEIKAVCSVGCCYHLLSEEHEMHEEGTRGIWGFPLSRYLKEEGWFCGRNARMAACLALERVAVGQVLPTESLFYRAVLQVIVEECYGIKRSDRNIGKVYSKSSSFLDYVRTSLKKLELDESKISDSLALEYLEKYKHRMNELEAFNMLKVVLGPCIEVLILLDRLCYLKEQDNVAWSGLVKLFDAIKSPRCYAVVALKK
ncbi:methyltransferase-like protein 25 isoform X3 [Python bivittatus]|uniref:Methyltransferase-like protein 25 isoform X3 n=1 Tax=Python bivittatus TaxID=176946 RepID=A0A9F2QZ50_PYTBI|nr:methyltransferase-like protein 25 isoform X3 [Python bivittatus]